MPHSQTRRITLHQVPQPSLVPTTRFEPHAERFRVRHDPVDESCLVDRCVGVFRHTKGPHEKSRVDEDGSHRDMLPWTDAVNDDGSTFVVVVEYTLMTCSPSAKAKARKACVITDLAVDAQPSLRVELVGIRVRDGIPGDGPRKMR